DQWQPALAVTPDGSKLAVFWYDRRLDPANYLIDRFGAIATVSASTVAFGPNFRITDVSSPPAFDQDPFLIPLAPGYMGDYDQAVADRDSFSTTWGDNRVSDAFFANQPDVRFAKVPIGGDSSFFSLMALPSPFPESTSVQVVPSFARTDWSEWMPTPGAKN